MLKNKTIARTLPEYCRFMVDCHRSALHCDCLLAKKKCMESQAKTQTEKDVFKTLSPDTAHIWHFDLRQYVASGFSSILSADEAERAENFRFRKDELSYRFRRSILRSLLSGYLECRPEDISFTYGPQGKPGVCTEESRQRIQFNMSTSDGICVLVFSTNTVVGIDVEKILPLKDCEQLLQIFATDREQRHLHHLHRTERLSEFYRLWTIKEAVLKSVGCGFSTPGTSVAVPPGGLAHVTNEVEIGPQNAKKHRYFRQLDLGAGLSAAVASDQSLLHLQYFDGLEYGALVDIQLGVQGLMNRSIR